MQIPQYDKDSRVVVITVGLPASGKSTWAKELVASEPNRWKRINRDDLRLMLHGRSHDYSSYEHEKAVTEASDALVRAAIESGHDVVMDNTSLKVCDRKSAHTIASSCGNCTVIEKVFCVTLETALERNAKREGLACVPEDVIRSMAKRYQVQKDGTFRAIKDNITVYENVNIVHLEQDSNLPPVVICDLDGTLCKFNGRNPYDAAKCESDLPNEPVINVLVNCTGGWGGPSSYLIFMSGRSSEFRPQTERWLKTHLAPYSLKYELYMRTEGDLRKDAVVKRELYERHISGKYYVRFVLDDRDQVVALWRSMGLTCFQVEYGRF